jgi:hypothetical protein
MRVLSDSLSIRTNPNSLSRMGTTNSRAPMHAESITATLAIEASRYTRSRQTLIVSCLAATRRVEARSQRSQTRLPWIRQRCAQSDEHRDQNRATPALSRSACRSWELRGWSRRFGRMPNRCPAMFRKRPGDPGPITSESVLRRSWRTSRMPPRETADTWSNGSCQRR